MGRTSDADLRLMDAALELIWEESYGAVTIEDICDRAKVKKGSFYYFYDSKASLAAAALERMWETSWKPRMDSIFSPSVAPIQRLRNYFIGVYDWQSELKSKRGRVLGCPVSSVGSETSTSGDHCAETAVCVKTREITGRKRPYVEQAIREAMADGTVEPGDAAKRAVVVLSFIEGMVARARLMDDTEILRDVLPLGFEVLRAKLPAVPEPAPGPTEAAAR